MAKYLAYPEKILNPGPESVKAYSPMTVQKRHLINDSTRQPNDDNLAMELKIPLNCARATGKDDEKRDEGSP